MKLRENIYSVRVTDSDIRLFHGYETPFGTTYNSYLIVDDKVTLIDFVKKPFSDELLGNIRNILGERKVDIIICNHAEPDHSGALPHIVKAFPEAVVYGTANCRKELELYYPEAQFTFQPVAQGDTLSTGRYTFTFYPIPMLHWPDSMATYLKEEAILFPNDAFGQHLGIGKALDYEVEREFLLERAGDYFANILLLYGSTVAKFLETASELPLSMICPSHGLILQDAICDVLSCYDKWSKQDTHEKKVAIVFDTMWGTTTKMADRLAAEYREKGFSVELINLTEHHYSYAVTKLLDAKYIFVGSSTLNNQMLPSVSAFLTYLKGLRPSNRVGKAFGSYGWSGESVKQIHQILESCGFEMLEPYKVLWNIKE